MALRENSTLYWLLTDHLGSTAKVANGSTPTGELRYKAWGETRYTWGTTPTDRQYTGQVLDSQTNLLYYGARYYAYGIGRFVQPDTIVPEPGNPQALNRYAYTLNNPLKYIDPSGFDPLDAAWEAEFYTNHGRLPTDQDRQLRLYSLMYNGPASQGVIWTEADWMALYNTPNGGVAAAFQSTEGRHSLDDFANAIDRLSSWYNDDEQAQFVSAIALIYAGVPYQPDDRLATLRHGFGGAVQLRYLNHGMEGFDPSLYNVLEGFAEENTHHYAGHLLAGFNLGYVFGGTVGRGMNQVGTWIRELAQGQVLNVDQADVRLGEIAGRHGSALAHGAMPRDLGFMIRLGLSRR